MQIDKDTVVYILFAVLLLSFPTFVSASQAAADVKAKAALDHQALAKANAKMSNALDLLQVIVNHQVQLVALGQKITSFGPGSVTDHPDEHGQFDRGQNALQMFDGFVNSLVTQSLEEVQRILGQGGAYPMEDINKARTNNLRYAVLLTANKKHDHALMGLLLKVIMNMRPAVDEELRNLFTMGSK